MAATRHTKNGNSDKDKGAGGKAGDKDIALKKPQVRKPVVGKKDIALKKEVRAGRVEGVKAYFRGVWGELKKVHWPTRREVVIYTGVVLVAVSIVAVLLWIFDSILSRVLQLIIK